MKYIFVIAICILLFSCQKEFGRESCTSPTNNTSNAQIVWTGPVETDGCSWVVVINNTHYHPNTLSPSFQQDQLDVLISYEFTNDHFLCGIAGSGLPIINITSIRPQ